MINKAVFVFLILVSCTSVVDLDLEEQEKELVLNCILNSAGDTITAWLSLSAPINEGASFEPVFGATIRLTEDGNLVGSFIHTDSSAYVLPCRVKPGARYRIDALTDNKNLWAETIVPLPVNARIDTIKYPFGNIPLYRIAFTMQFDDNPREKNYYWVALQKTWEYEKKIERMYLETIYSNTLMADDFNRFIEDYYGFRFSFGDFMRLDDSFFSGQTCSVIVGGSYGYSVDKLNSRYRIFLLHVDQHLDRYMKTALVRREMDLMSEEYPILYAPFPVYSNIQNGKGIFGAVNTQYKEVAL